MNDYIVCKNGNVDGFIKQYYNDIAQEKFEELLYFMQNDDILFPYWLSVLNLHNKNPFYTNECNAHVSIIKYKDLLYKSMQYLMHDKNISRNHGRKIVYETFDKRTNKLIQKRNNMRNLIIDKCYEIMPRIFRYLIKIRDKYNKKFLKKIIDHYIDSLRPMYTIDNIEVIFLNNSEYNNLCKSLMVVSWENNIEKIVENLYDDKALRKLNFDVNDVINKCESIFEHDLSRTIDQDKEYNPCWFNKIKGKIDIGLFEQLVPFPNISELFSRTFIRCTINGKKSLILILQDKRHNSCYLKILNDSIPLTLTDKLMGGYFDCNDYLCNNNEDYKKLYNNLESNYIDLYNSDLLYLAEENFIQNIFNYILGKYFVNSASYNTYRLQNTMSSVIFLHERDWYKIYNDIIEIKFEMSYYCDIHIIINKKTLKTTKIDLLKSSSKEEKDLEGVYAVVNIFKNHLQEIIDKYKDQYYYESKVVNDAISNAPLIYADIDNIENFIIEQDYYYHNGNYLKYMESFGGINTISL